MQRSAIVKRPHLGQVSIHLDDFSSSMGIGLACHYTLCRNINFSKFANIIAKPEPGSFIINVRSRLESYRHYFDTFRMG
jgi:hypothetical protein